MKMEARSSKIGINQQHPAARLSDERLRQVCCHEGLALCRSTAGDEKFLEWLGRSNLVKSRSQCSELLRTEVMLHVGGENTCGRFDAPIPCATAYNNLFKRKRFAVALWAQWPSRGRSCRC